MTKKLIALRIERVDLSNFTNWWRSRVHSYERHCDYLRVTVPNTPRHYYEDVPKTPLLCYEDPKGLEGSIFFMWFYCPEHCLFVKDACMSFNVITNFPLPGKSFDTDSGFEWHYSPAYMKVMDAPEFLLEAICIKEQQQQQTAPVIKQATLSPGLKPFKIKNALGGSAQVDALIAFVRSLPLPWRSTPAELFNRLPPNEFRWLKNSKMLSQELFACQQLLEINGVNLKRGKSQGKRLIKIISTEAATQQN